MSLRKFQNEDTAMICYYRIVGAVLSLFPTRYLFEYTMNLSLEKPSSFVGSRTTYPCSAETNSLLWTVPSCCGLHLNARFKFAG